MSLRERFELEYEQFTGIAIKVIQGQRMSNGSYLLPTIAKAWYWYQKGAAGGEG